jgi:phage-related protein
MAGPAILKIDILADASKAGRALEKTSGAAHGLGKTLGGLAKIAAGAFAVGSVVKFGATSVKAAEESEVATKRLGAVFKSMGDKTGLAAKAAENYAGKLSAQIGVDDEAIMAAQALLATFGNVSSAAGRQAGIFDRATAAAADMAAAGYGNLTSNAIQLGKALQDPIKGVGALGKAGVTFTKQQKDQIKVLVASGDILAAQKIVMGEVEHQVKGTAAATATGSAKMKVAFGEVQEQIGKALLPFVSAAAGGIVNLFQRAQPIIASVMGAIQRGALLLAAAFIKNWPKIKAIAIEVFQAIAATVLPIVRSLARYAVDVLWPALQKVFAAVVKVAPDVIHLFQKIGEIGQAIWPTLLAVMKEVAPVVATIAEKLILLVGWLSRNYDIVIAILAPVLAYMAALKLWALYQAAVVAVTTAWTGVQAALNAVMAANPIILVVVAVVALIAAIVLAYRRVDWFHNLIDKVWQIMQAAFYGIRDAAIAAFTWIRSNWPLLLAILAGPIGVATLMIIRNWDKLKGAATAVWEWIRAAFQAVVDFIGGIPRKIGDALSRIADIITRPFRDAFNSIARLWNDTVGSLSFKVPGWVPGLGGKGFDVPDIPTLDRGGMVARTGLAVVHAGERYSGVGAGARAFGGAPTTVNIHIHNDGLGASSPQVQRAVVNALRGYQRRNGPIDIAVKAGR